MVTGNMLRRQRFMHYDASFDRPNRNCRTHANDQLISRLKKLPLQSRLEMNKKIMDRNRARRERACSNSDEVSDVESLITIEDEEMDDIRSDPDVFAAAKPLLDAATIRELNRANKEDATREKEARLTLGDSEWALEPDAILTKIDATQPNPISFPPEMFFTANKHNFPLAFFTPKNLSFINSILHKNAHEDKKYILNISDMEKKIKGAKTGPSRDEEMTVLDWWKAYNNYYAFESSRSMSLENNPRALFFKSHFNFFVNQEDSEELYDIWRPYEAKLRQRHYELDMEFDAAMYANTWTEIKAISASRPKQYAAKKKTYRHVYPSSLSYSKKNNSSSKPPFSPPPYQPFHTGNQDKDLAPRCIGCGQRGHKIGDKNANHGRFPFVLYSGTEIRTKDGNKKICILYNCLGLCNKGCSRNKHICSLCGGTHSCRDYHPSCARIG
ncbi:hypothetical protein DFH05DRAFT_1257656 [Lentinula detonsa]|uniref:Uncharacterized protein n=1 Tax=Lentinula detonsa TaxID=2804962 RepID=A0A9W8NXN5_9AGAR|nr:hypothetical protein DFH05DRAFT_1257656 [Lentinula detonsa]